ncbi:hypothetical protein VPHK120G1_0071 [Vibrio phage K120 g1]
MAEPAKIDLTTVKRGDTYIVDFYFSDTDGTKDISAVTIDAQARREMDGALWFDLKPVKVDASNGHFRIHLTHDETRSITESPPGSFSGIFDIQFSWQGASEVYVSTIVAGSISISKDVTQPVSLQTSGSSPMVPPSSQEVNVYLSLNPGSPNYSDVVTAEQLTPVQYDLSASLGLANVNAINEAAESAKIAKAAAAEALVYKNEARQSATLATMQATKATNEADRAKTEADKAKQVSGLDTVDQAVDMAMAEFAGMMTESERNAILRMNENVNFDASGMVHTGKHLAPSSSIEVVNEGLWVAPSTTSLANSVILGRGVSPKGASKTKFAVAHIAGSVSNLLGTRDNNPNNLPEFKFDLPPAPDGTDIYDSTGDCRGSGKAALNLKTDIDPKYGNVPAGSEAQILREAVARAFEGLVKNGDFRLGDNGDWGTAGSNPPTLSDDGSYFPSASGILVPDFGSYIGETYEVEISALPDTPTGGNLGALNYNSGVRIAYIKEGITKVTYTHIEGQPSTKLYLQSAVNGLTITGVKIRKVTEVVVTHPVDSIFIESYDEELTGRVEIMENIQSLSTTFGTTSVPTVLSIRKLSYFQQYDGQFPEVAINPDFINDRYRCVVWTDLTEPQKREIAAYMGEKLFMGVNGFPVNTRNRALTIRGLGNGDWHNINSVEGVGLQFSAATTSAMVQPKGIKDSVSAFNDVYDRSYISPNNSYSSNALVKGVFVPRGTNAAYPESVAYQGRCFMYVVATVPRANQGAYHEKFNPYGTRKWNKIDNTGAADWHAGTVGDITNAQQAFDVQFGGLGRVGAHAGTGNIATGQSGHPDGIFYDGIEAGGLNGVIDWRLGAVANDSPEEAAKVEAKVENDTYRGLEKLVRTNLNFVASASGANRRINHPDGSGLGEDEIVHDYIASGSGTSANNSGITLYNLTQGKDISKNCWIYAGDVHCGGADADDGDVIMSTVYTNLSVSGEFNTKMVIAPPENILLTDALKDGWLGTWCPVMQDGVTDNFPFPSKAVAGLTSGTKTLAQRTDNKGASWGSYTTYTIDKEENYVRLTDSPAGRVTIVHYKAWAEPTKKSTNKPVLNATKGLLGVTVTQSHDKAVLAESVAGIILKSDASGIVTEQSQAVKYLVDGTIKRLKTLPTDMAAPTNNSQAIKIAVYQISNNGQTSLAIIANTMTHNGTSWGELEEVQIPSSGSGTFPDGNNITQQAFCTELSIPTGWASNIARVGTQVPGVDL